ncbi:superfamily II DNA/RNA helicase [Pseudonocardia eucalypti]|uniref:DEAD/DEAH box helicase n=1 Tax=Pseudonocardia eucalypti TaxID=648755 RepID=UPI00179FACCA|nr:superfamily II DNA/RNA helicase [Pseudonocardia eucalypti]
MPAPLIAALAAQGVVQPFPIQAATLPHSLAGRDVLGRGRTGSGKTYAFLLPVLARLVASARPRRAGRPRALILAPTRELATQIHAAVAPLADALALRATTVFGGVRPGQQVAALAAGVDILVACPGRLLDHLSSGHASLASVEITVLDEADHMADLGFLPAVRELLSQTPSRGQRLLFSATLDAGIDVLAKRFLNDPITHSVDETPSPTATMSHHVLRVRAEDRMPVLTDLAAAPGRTLVFTRTKRGAARLARQLATSGVAAVELHGNLGQQARSRNLRAFAEGAASTLVATDIAARGIHVDGIELVIHADPPAEHKAYVHRSGRTARAGAEGTVVTLMTNTQAREVATLLRRAGIAATTTEVGPGHAMLTRLAPGTRHYTATAPAPEVKPARRRRKANPPANAAEGRQPKSPRGSAGRSKSRHRAGHGGSGHGGSGQGGTAGTATRRGGAADLSARTRVGARRGR